MTVLSVEQILSAAEALPRWRVFADHIGGLHALVVDRDWRAGLVHPELHGDRWTAHYYAHAQDYAVELRHATTIDDSVWAVAEETAMATRVFWVPISDDDPAAAFREIERMRDADLLSRDDVRRHVGEVTAALSACAVSPGDPWESTGSLDLPNGAYVQWTRVAGIGTPVHVELSDGSDYSEPMPPEMVALLCDHGWEAPNDTFRNVWVRVGPDAGFDSAAELIARTVFLALGADPWRLPKL